MTFLDIVLVIIVVAGVINGIVLVRGRSPWNRLLGYTLVANKVTLAILVVATSSRNTFYLDIAIVYALLSFIGVTALSDYLADDKNRTNPDTTTDAVAEPGELATDPVSGLRPVESGWDQ